VTNALIKQVTQRELTLPNPTVRYCLVAGKIHGLSPEKFQQYQDFFSENGWILYGPAQIREEIQKLVPLSYENDVAIIMAKLLGRT
jgi:hypothetical protein